MDEEVHSLQQAPHIASHALQRFKNALQNTDVATDICVGKSIRYGLYE
jgi:hypothetical protein